MILSKSFTRIEVAKKSSIIYPVVTDDVTFSRFNSVTSHWESLKALSCDSMVCVVVSVTERLRCRFGTREVPGSNPLIRIACTCSHQPTQLSISGSVNEYPGYSFQNITLGPPSRRSTSAVKLPINQPALTTKHCLLACCICKAEFPLTHFARC